MPSQAGRFASNNTATAEYGDGGNGHGLGGRKDKTTYTGSWARYFPLFIFDLTARQDVNVTC